VITPKPEGSRMSESQSASSSRLSLSNRADGQNGGIDASAVPLAKEDGTRSRESVTFPTWSGTNALTWEKATESFESWYLGQRDTAVVIENEEGKQAAFQTPNRFTPEYREMLYAKAQALERGLKRRWGKLLHTGMLSLTASTTTADGAPRPPVEHLTELLSSWEAVRRELSRTFEDREWEYLGIIEPHESGYAHVHVGVFVKGPIVAEQFQSVIDAHVRNCPSAQPEAHELLDQVTVKQAGTRDNGGIENLGAYLASYIGGEYEKEATQMDGYVKRFYAMMWATGRQWFRPSNGAQELMQPPENESIDNHDWRFIGIAPDGDPDSEIIEVDPSKSSGTEYERLSTDMPPPDQPPPDQSSTSTSAQFKIDDYE